MISFDFGFSHHSPATPKDFTIQETNKRTCMVFFEQWHYLGNQDFISTRHYGAFFDGRNVGAISYGPPNATEVDGYFNRFTQSGWFEIKRLAMEDDCPRNSESRFISQTIKMLRRSEKVQGIITLADSSVGHIGTIYRAANFKYLGLTSPKMDFWVNGSIKQRGKTRGVQGEWKPRSRKHLYVMDFRSS